MRSVKFGMLIGAIVFVVCWLDLGCCHGLWSPARWTEIETLRVMWLSYFGALAGALGAAGG